MRTGESLILALAQAATTYNTSNAAWGRWGILNRGKSDHYVVMKPGAFTRVFEGMNRVTYKHQTIVQVWQRYKDDGTSIDSLITNANYIIAAVDAKPTLGDTTNTVQRATITRASEVQEMWKRGGGPSWLKLDLIVEWEEKQIVTFS